MTAAAPSLRERVGAWIAGARAGAPPIEWNMSAAASFGPAVGNQPSHQTLLSESLGVVDTATRAIANRVSSINPMVCVKREFEPGMITDEILDTHPLKMLLDKPHPNMSRRQLLRLTGQYIVTVGEAYWLKVGSGLGVPVELHNIPPSQINPIVRQGVVEGYQATDGNGRRIDLDTDVVIRFFFPDPEQPWASEGYFGPSGVTADARKFAGQHLRRHFEHDATPKSALEPQEGAQAFDSSQAERFRTLWSQLYNSRHGDATGAPGIIPSNYKLIQMAMQSGADVTPLLEHWRDDLLMAFGVPRSILGQVVSGDRSSAETNQYVFDLHTILPIAQMIEDALTLQLASDFEGDVFVCFEDFVAKDKQFHLVQEQSDLDRKVRSINEVLRDRGEDVVEWGDEPVGKVGEIPYTGEGFDFSPADEPEPMEFEDEPAGEDEDDRTRGALASGVAWQRQLASEARFIPAFYQTLLALLTLQKRSVLERLEARMPGSRALADELFKPAEWRALFARRLEPVRERAYEATLAATLGDLGISDFMFTDAAKAALRRDGARLVTWALSTTKRKIVKQVEAGLAEGEGVEQIATRLRKEFKARRKEAITTARTEVLKATSQATLDGFKVAGVQKMRWHTSRDDAVRETHVAMEGVTVDVGEAFVVPTLTGGTELAGAPRQGYKGGFLSAANTINCRCFMVPINRIGGAGE